MKCASRSPRSRTNASYAVARFRPEASMFGRMVSSMASSSTDACIRCCSAIEKYCQATGENEYDDWAVLDYVQEEVCTACPEYEGGCCVKRVMTCEKVITKYGGSEHE